MRRQVMCRLYENSPFISYFSLPVACENSRRVARRVECGRGFRNGINLQVGIFKWLAIFSIATNILVVVPPLFMLQVYSRVLSSGSLETLIYMSLIAIIAMWLFGVAETVRMNLAQKASAKYTVQIADKLFDALSRQATVEKSTQTLRDFSAVKNYLASRSFIGLFDLPFVPLFILLLFILHPTIGLITVLGTVGLVTIAWYNRATTDDKSRQSKKIDSQAFSFAQAVFSRSEDIRAMGILTSIKQRWGEKMADAINSGDDANTRSAMFYGLSRALRKSLQITIMAWGAYLALNGDISGGAIFAGSMISGRALQPIEQLIGGWSQLSQVQKSHARLGQLLDDAADYTEPVTMPQPNGEIHVENLTYTVNNGEKPVAILNNVSFDLPFGKILVIVGPSGAGKSTLVRALVGALTPTAGQIMLDGIERSSWSDEQWGEIVGYVPQENTLFPGTLIENIARLNPSPDEARVIEAAQTAGIHKMIANLPRGYHTVIGPGRMNLSGGQKQRVAFARALYSNPQVLVLDEPNSHLDRDAEKMLVKSLENARDEHKTVIVVTQRRSILRCADFIMTMNDGNLESFAENKKRLKVDPPALNPETVSKNNKSSLAVDESESDPNSAIPVVQYATRQRAS